MAAVLHWVAEPVQPRPATWTAVRSRAARLRDVDPAIPRRGRRTAGGLLSAALVALIAVASSSLSTSQPSGAPRAGDVAGAVSVLTQPGTRIVALTGGADQRSSLLVSADRQTVVLVIDRLAAAPAGHVYQAWFHHGAGRVSAGTFAGGGPVVLTAAAPLQLPDYDGFGVTLEPGLGSPFPTGARVAGVDGLH